MVGKFIVLEGIDGAGCGTQTEILRENLSEENKLFPVTSLRYPDYNTPIGEIIHEFLHGAFDIDTATQFLLYSADVVKDIRKIKRDLQKGKIILSDRYFTSTLAYQTVQGFPLEKVLKFAELFGIIKPDLVIYLDVPVKISEARKLKEKRKLDKFEKDIYFRKKVKEQYEKMVSKNIFAKRWVRIDAGKNIEEVANEVRDSVRKILGL